MMQTFNINSESRSLTNHTVKLCHYGYQGHRLCYRLGGDKFRGICLCTGPTFGVRQSQGHGKGGN